MSSPKRGLLGLAILAGLASLAHIVGALQSFGMMPVAGGAGAGFFVYDPISGIIQVVAALVTGGLAYGLWRQHAWARKAVVAIAAVNIAVIFFTHFGADESWWNAVPGIVVNAVILLYAMTPAVRQEFDR